MRLAALPKSSFDPGKHNKKAYESHLAQTGNNPYDMPYYRFILDQLARQVSQDIELEVMWQGKNMGVINDAPNPARDVQDGLLQKAYTTAVAGESPVAISGPITFTNAVSRVDNWVKACLSTSALRRQAWTTFCSQDTVDKYQESYRANYGGYIHANEFDSVRIQGTNTMLVPVAGLEGSELFMAKQSNLFFGYDGDMSFLVERRRREIDFIIDGKVSVDFALASEVFINEQALLQS